MHSTRSCENILKDAKDADILIHEVYSYAGWKNKNEFWQKYHKANHTSSRELADLATKTKPGKIILNHALYWGVTDKDLLKEITEIYDGKLLVRSDLMMVD
ncbi:MAG: hypothetical protein HQ522_15015 [Bacteroidetes bacterium]|nr:hypothetical protein [Bacteroidota bacterium]